MHISDFLMASSYSHRSSQSSGQMSTFGQDQYGLENNIERLRLHGSSKPHFPLSTHSPWHPKNIEDQEKETMSKQEIEDLRSSVLRTNRPVNPWFDAQKKISTPESTPSTSSSSPTLNSTTAPISTTKNSLISSGNTKMTCSQSSLGKPLYYDKQVKMEGVNRGHLTGRINWQRNGNAPTRREPDNTITQPYLLPKKKIPVGPPTKPPRREEYALDYTQMLASDIQLLEQLEAEHLERASKVMTTSAVKTSADNNAPTHQPKQMVNTVKSGPNSGLGMRRKEQSSYPDQTPAFESNNYQKRRQEKVPLCSSCGGVIRDVILQALGQCFHPTCFRCHTCRVCLDGVPFAVNSAKEVFCMDDYRKATVFPTCAACKGTICASNELGEIVRIVAQHKEYHIECYNCEGCGLQLSNEISSKCYPLSTHSTSHLLCKACHLQWRRLRESLQTPMTDL